MLTNASKDLATQYLNDYENDLSSAVNAYFAIEAEDEEETYKREPTGGRPQMPVQTSSRSQLNSESNQNVNTLGGGGSTTSSSRFMSFSDLVRGNADADDDDEKPRTTFAGGETSGLEVADPNFGKDKNHDNDALLRDLLEKAKKGGQQLENGEFDNNNEDDDNNKADRFEGRGYRLGNTENSKDQIVEDNTTKQENSKPKKVTREITFWKDGFQVGDGKLYKYDDPANAFYLKELNQGHAPLKLLDVEFGQEVNVNVYKKLDEEYKPPKRPLGGFSGQGQRLGAPVPGDAEIKQASPSPVPIEKPEPKKGNTAIQIRYANGKKEVYKCDSNDTVEMLYAHVQDNTADSREFTLNTSFPVMPIPRNSSTVNEAKLANSVVVQRWKQ